MNFRVTPVDGATVPSSAAHVSSGRTLVVPTATTRPPPPRAALISAAASGACREQASVEMKPRGGGRHRTGIPRENRLVPDRVLLLRGIAGAPPDVRRQRHLPPPLH